MWRDLKALRRNSGKNPPPEANNENLDPLDSATTHLESDSYRPPLITIQDPYLNPKPETDHDDGGDGAASVRKRAERTPTKNSQFKGPDGLLRTPEKHASLASLPKNRFGWSGKNELYPSGGDSCDNVGHQVAGILPPLGRHGYTTPRAYRNAGKASSVHSETSSTHSTPTKSVNKPPNPGAGGSRPSLVMGPRAATFAAATARGFPISSVQSTVVNSVEVPNFELKEDPSFWMDHNVQVIIRVRPLNSMEKTSQGYNRCLKQESPQSISWMGQPESRFTFDHVACESIDQETLFRVVGLPMVENCMSGYNSCIFAYGQTGSGKTYTMLGEIDDLEGHPKPQRGMTPRMFEFLFARIRAEEENRRSEKLKYNCKCSFLEIYNEQIADLLDPSSTNLLLREDVQEGVYVENLTEFAVENVNDILKLLVQGAANRKVASTNMNRESSRSHSVFTCVIESRWEKDSLANLRFARLNLVDLAGSERQKSSGAEGERLKEAANINKSLSTLGHVIMVLVDVAHGKQRHVPYRDSRLTFLLQDSLGGNSKTMIIANISPSICCTSETLSTLKFAQRAKLIQNNAFVNEDASGDITALQHQIRLLKEELAVLKRLNIPRSISFRKAIFDGGEGEKYDLSAMEKLTEVLSEEDNTVSSDESINSIRVSVQQLKSLEAMLAGALRREKMADIAVKQVEAEVEQLNRLVRQREEDTRCSKMMLKFREDKIRRMEAIVDDLIPAESYLLEENNTLVEEVKLLRGRLDKNPEVTRFALENIRLLDQLRRFQDFYEEGEREMLLAEISELRNQPFKFLDGKPLSDNNSVLNEASYVASSNLFRADDALQIELKKTCQELEDCRSNLKSCLGVNEKLTREIDELHFELKNLKAVKDKEDSIEESDDMEVCSVMSLANSNSNEKIAGHVFDATTKHAEEILNLQLELDILKIILGEDRLSLCDAEERFFLVSKKLEEVEERELVAMKQCDDMKHALRDARILVENFESQQILLINELEELQENYTSRTELLKNQETEITMLKKQLGFHFDVKGSYSHQDWKNQQLNHPEKDSHLRLKLNKMQASLDKARILNMRYQHDYEAQTSLEQEMEEVCRQAEAETAEVIVCLQEEIKNLQQQVDNCNQNELQARGSLVAMENEMRNLQDRLYSLTQDKENLTEALEEKDNELRSLIQDWECVAHEISKFLDDGNLALEYATNQVDMIVESMPQGIWVCEKINRMVRSITEKDSMIEELRKSLEDAQNIRCDMEWKLRSLRGASLAIAEAQQHENIEKEREILLLTSNLSEKATIVAELEDKIKNLETQLKASELQTTVFLLTIKRFSEINSVYFDALLDKELQLNEFVAVNMQKDASLNDQNILLACSEEKVRSIELKLHKSVKNVSELQTMLSDKQDHILSLELQLEKMGHNFYESILDNDLLTTEEKLNKFKFEVTSVQSFMDEYNGQEVGISRKSLPWKNSEGSENDNHEGRLNGKSIRSVGKGTRFNVHDQIDASYLKAENVCSRVGRESIDSSDKEIVILLLRKEIEAALESLKEVQMQMDEVKKTEIRNKMEVQNLTMQVVMMESEMRDKEKEIKFKLEGFDEKLKLVEGKLKNSITFWDEAKKDFMLEISEANELAAQKSFESSILLAQFEEAQETMKEADAMLNTLLRSNEAAKLEIQRHLNIQNTLIGERDKLAHDLLRVHSSLEMMGEQYEALQKNFLSNMTEMESLVLTVESMFLQLQNTYMKEFKMLSCECHSLRSLFHQSADSKRKFLEDVWADIIGKDCAVSVLHHCHIGILLETIIGLNAKNGFLQCGLDDSNSVIAGLRVQNFRGKEELEMCNILQGKLLVDINTSFNRIARNEVETGNLKAKVNALDKKIIELQLQEETMLARSNAVDAELSGIIEDFAFINSNVWIDSFSKEIELVILLQEIKNKNALLNEKILQMTEVEKETDALRNYVMQIQRERVLLLVESELGKQMLVDMDIEINFLKKKAADTDTLLRISKSELKRQMLKCKGSSELVSEMENKVKTLEQTCHENVLREHEMKDSISRLHVCLEEKGQEIKTFEQSGERIIKELELKNQELNSLLERVDALTSDNSRLTDELENVFKENRRLSLQIGNLCDDNANILKSLQAKDLAIASYAAANIATDQASTKYKDEVGSLHSAVHKLETELEAKNANIIELQKCKCNTIQDLEYERNEALDLRARFSSLQNENEILKAMVSEFSSEYSFAVIDFELKKIELESSYQQMENSVVDNQNLQHTISSLESCISNLQTDIHMKNLELNEVQSSLSFISKETDLKIQENDFQVATINALKLENECVRGKLISLNEVKDQALGLLTVNLGKFTESVQLAIVQLNKISHILDDTYIPMIDDMLCKISDYKEMSLKFISEFEILELSVSELQSKNLFLCSELMRKDEICKGLLFDLSSLQESFSLAKDQKDQLERDMAAKIQCLEGSVAMKTNELHKLISHSEMLEEQLADKCNLLMALEAEHAKECESVKLVFEESIKIKQDMEDTLLEKNTLEEKLVEKNILIESFESKAFQMESLIDQQKILLAGLQHDLTKTEEEKDGFHSQICDLTGKVEMAHALAEENEAVAMEAQQIATSRREYADAKENEVKLLEKSIEELECTIDVLQNKVEIVKDEAERQRVQREELEIELHEVKRQFLDVKTYSAQSDLEESNTTLSRRLENPENEFEVAKQNIKILRKNLADKDAEITQHQIHINELNTHAEAQARQNMHRIKELEAMVQQVKAESSSYNMTNLTANRCEKSAAKSRGSGSPFKCIGLGLTQQVNSEKDEELNARKLRIQELEASIVHQQKEIFSLNARLAASESMTHDVIRDLLGLKLDITNYASLVDHQESRKIMESACLHNENSLKKEDDMNRLKKQLNEFIEERQGWLDELNRRHAEVMATKIALEKLRQQEQFLSTENEILKVDNAKQKKTIVQLEDEVKKLYNQQNLQNRIHHHAKIKEENNMLRIQKQDLASKLQQSEIILSRVREELAHYRASSAELPYIDFDEQQRLKAKLEDAENERVQLTHKLLGLCTCILKAAGLTEPLPEINPTTAENILHLLKDHVVCLENQLEDMKFKDKVFSEKMRLFEIMQRNSPQRPGQNEDFLR